MPKTVLFRAGSAALLGWPRSLGAKSRSISVMAIFRQLFPADVSGRYERSHPFADFQVDQLFCPVAKFRKLDDNLLRFDSPQPSVLRLWIEAFPFCVEHVNGLVDFLYRY